MCIPQLITESDNEGLTEMPSREEIKKVVFAHKGDSSGGFDSVSRIFCWDIVGGNIERMVTPFY